MFPRFNLCSSLKVSDQIKPNFKSSSSNLDIELILAQVMDYFEDLSLFWSLLSKIKQSDFSAFLEVETVIIDDIENAMDSLHLRLIAICNEVFESLDIDKLEEVELKPTILHLFEIFHRIRSIFLKYLIHLELLNTFDQPYSRLKQLMFEVQMLNEDKTR